MDFKCYPVILQDNEHERRAKIFWKMQDEGLDKVVFYDTLSSNIDLWLKYSTLPNGWTAPVYNDKGELIACGWLNGFMGKSAFCHFIVFKAYRKYKIEIGKVWLKAIFATKQFDSLCGFTPSVYRSVLSFIKLIGFELAHLRVPGACYIARKDRCVDGVFSIITRDKVCLLN